MSVAVKQAKGAGQGRGSGWHEIRVLRRLGIHASIVPLLAYGVDHKEAWLVLSRENTTLAATLHEGGPMHESLTCALMLH
jgi:hypothetical protein